MAWDPECVVPITQKGWSEGSDLALGGEVGVSEWGDKRRSLKVHHSLEKGRKFAKQRLAEN